MSSWLDQLPSSERAKIRQRLRSPEAYEKLREKVKGPEDVEQEMERNEVMAELKFALETEPTVKEALKSAIEKDVGEQGIDAICEKVNPSDVASIENGAFSVRIEAPDQNSAEHIVLVPDSNPQEKLSLTQKMGEKYIQQFISR